MRVLVKDKQLKVVKVLPVRKTSMMSLLVRSEHVTHLRIRRQLLWTCASWRDRRRCSSWTTTEAPFSANHAQLSSMSSPSSSTRWQAIFSGGVLLATLIRFFIKKSISKSKTTKICNAKEKSSFMFPTKVIKEMWTSQHKQRERSMICSSSSWLAPVTK